MNFQQLRAVRETTRSGFSLTEVAGVLHTSQPGISRQIRELEDELGIEIFVRVGKRLTQLTPPGEAVLPICAHRRPPRPGEPAQPDSGNWCCAGPVARRSRTQEPARRRHRALSENWQSADAELQAVDPPVHCASGPAPRHRSQCIWASVAPATRDLARPAALRRHTLPPPCLPSTASIPPRELVPRGGGRTGLCARAGARSPPRCARSRWAIRGSH